MVHKPLIWPPVYSLLGGWAPMTCKWLVTMVRKPPKDRVVNPFQMAVSWLINGGYELYLLAGMALQVLSRGFPTNPTSQQLGC